MQIFTIVMNLINQIFKEVRLEMLFNNTISKLIFTRFTGKSDHIYRQSYTECSYIRR